MELQKVSVKVFPNYRSGLLQKTEQICKSEGVRFEDPSFGPFSDDITPTIPGIGKLEWGISSQILGFDAKLYDDIKPLSLKQGFLSGTFFFNALLCLAEKPLYINRLFSQDKISSCGAYGVWLQKDGCWKELIVDELIPVFRQNDGISFAGFQSTRKEMWPFLLEKAYAKLWGGYKNIQYGNSHYLLRELTGAPYTLFKDFSNQELLWERLQAAQERNWLLTASSDSSYGASLGVAREKVYCIKDLQEISDHLGKNTRIIRVADPQKSVKWTGPWSSGSVEWTSKHQKLMQNTGECFWISLQDFTRMFDTLGVFMIEDGFFSDHLLLAQNSSSKKMLAIKVEEETDITISVDQRDKRNHLDREGYSFLYLRLTVGKLSDGEVLFVDARLGCQKSIFVSDCLPSGDYIILVETYWPEYGLPQDVTLGLYSSSPVKLKEIDATEAIFNRTEYYLWANFSQNNRKSFEFKSKEKEYEV